MRYDGGKLDSYTALSVCGIVSSCLFFKDLSKAYFSSAESTMKHLDSGHPSLFCWLFVLVQHYGCQHNVVGV